MVVICRLPNRIETIKRTVTITLTGYFNSSYGYVQIPTGGTKYTSAQTVSIQKGTRVYVYVGCDIATSNLVKITKDGVVVSSGTSASHAFNADGNYQIKLSRQSVSGSDSGAYAAVITTL